MVDKIEILLERRPPPTALQRVFYQSTSWTFLVGAVGLSRIWFGGALVIDLAAFVFFFMLLYSMGKRSWAHLKIPRHEVRAWLEAGMPDKWP